MVTLKFLIFKRNFFKDRYVTTVKKMTGMKNTLYLLEGIAFREKLRDT